MKNEYPLTTLFLWLPGCSVARDASHPAGLHLTGGRGHDPGTLHRRFSQTRADQRRRGHQEASVPERRRLFEIAPDAASAVEAGNLARDRHVQLRPDRSFSADERQLGLGQRGEQKLSRLLRVYLQEVFRRRRPSAATGRRPIFIGVGVVVVSSFDVGCHRARSRLRLISSENFSTRPSHLFFFPSALIARKIPNQKNQPTPVSASSENLDNDETASTRK